MENICKQLKKRGDLWNVLFKFLISPVPLTHFDFVHENNLEQIRSFALNKPYLVEQSETVGTCNPRLHWGWYK